MSTRRSLLVSLFVTSLLVLLNAAPATAAAPATPRLELRAPSTSMDVVRYGRGPVFLELGITLVAHDAPFELRVARETYDDPIRVWQVFHRPGGEKLTELPGGILEGWTGLDRFLVIEVRHHGELVRRRVPDVCPGGWQSERFDDSGPFNPTYPMGCGWNPLTLGAVWGIDEGWSATPSMSNAFVRIPDGRYTVDVSIAPRYQTLLGVAPEDASVRVAIRVVTSSGCDFCERAVAEESIARRRLTPAPTVVAPDPTITSDLVALPAYGIGIDHSRRGRDYLTFGADVWNRGPAPLLVEGFRVEGEDRMDAYQYFTQDGDIVGRAAVGSFDFDHRPRHQHWHFLQFARYRLLDAGQVSAVRSKKQAFCLAPTDPIDLTVDGAMWRPDSLGFTQCGGETAIWIREVLPTGWGDTYYQGVPGQSFDITDLPNGTYWIEVRANPAGLLYDGDPSNDTELREVILGGSPGRRTVSVPPYHGIDTEGLFGGIG